jgi:conjugal transfer mating pair stabilization protein TraG
MDQVQGYGLTDVQMAFFRAASESFLPAGVHDLLDTDTSRATAQAREALIRAEGPTGEHIAELLTRSAISQDDTYLRTIGAYNRANTGSAPVSPPLSQSSVSDGWSGALLDLIAAPESRGNYNAWYGDAAQDRVDLSSFTVDQVRDLQADLVRSNGGSAIGRYQLLDDTLDGLVERLGLSGNERFTRSSRTEWPCSLPRMPAWTTDRREISDERFAENLSQVWAGLPRDGSNESYYAAYRQPGEGGLNTVMAFAAWDSPRHGEIRTAVPV